MMVVMVAITVVTRDSSDAQENLMKMLHHLTIGCGKYVVIAPCPMVVLLGRYPWSSTGNKCHGNMQCL
jgi:hypothetical protein